MEGNETPLQKTEQRGRDNSLAFIRLLAAIQVMAGHVINHMQLPVSNSLYSAVCFYNGVPIFFAMSGYLIWFSINRSKSFGEYAKKRFWRIYPELWIAVFVEIIVLLVLYSGIEWKSFLLFVFGQTTIFQFWTPSSLKGYGVGSPNGILGSISILVQFYIIAWPFYKVMKGKKVRSWIAGFWVSFFVSYALARVLESRPSYQVISKLFSVSVVRTFWVFYLGMMIAEFKDNMIPIIKKYWYVFLGVSIVSYVTGIDISAGYRLLWNSFLVVGVIGFAYQFPNIRISTDISYGMFVYHMTVVNAFVNFGLTGKWKYAVIVATVSVILAYGSTIIIEKLSATSEKSSAGMLRK